MKKSLSVILMCALVLAVFAAAPAEAGKKKKKKPVRVERVVEIDYSCPCGVNPVVGFKLDSITGENIGGATVPISTQDVYWTAKAEDASGQNIHVEFSQDTDGDGFNNNVGSFCGAQEEPQEVSHAESELRVFIYSGLCDDNSPAFASQGTITLTFSNMP